MRMVCTSSLPWLLDIRYLSDRADAIRTKRREAIALLDTLPESIFIEMFGDPATSGWRWRRRTLASACASQDDIRCGPFGTQLAKHEFRSDGVPLLGIKNVNAAFELPPWEFLDERTARRLSHYSIEPGDIVMTRKGTVGNCSVYPHGRSVAIMHSDLLRIRPSPIEFEAGFLAHQPSVDTAKPTFNRHLKIDNC